MGKIITNLVIVLGLITVAAGGYYVFIQKEDSVLNFSSNDQTMQNMLNNTQVFISRRQELNKVNMSENISIFDDAQFRSLRSFSSAVQERPVGRNNPFGTPVVPSNTTPGI
jgi:hypothetical protein